MVNSETLEAKLEHPSQWLCGCSVGLPLPLVMPRAGLGKAQVERSGIAKRRGHLDNAAPPALSMGSSPWRYLLGLGVE